MRSASSRRRWRALRARADGLHVMIARSFNHVGPRQNPFFAASGFARRIADIEAGRWDAGARCRQPRRPPRYPRRSRHRARIPSDSRARRRRPRVQRLFGPRNFDSARCSTSCSRSCASADQDSRRSGALPAQRCACCSLGDPTGCTTELGWLPEVALDQTIEDLLSYWRARSGA